MKIKDKNIAFVVNSNLKFYHITIPKVIKSLKDCNVTDIKVIAGGWEKEFEADCQDFTLYATTYDSCDYTTFNYIVDNPDKFKDFDYIFYMHDTCWVGPNFLLNLTNLMPEEHPSSTMLLNGMSMNIGLYNIQHLINNTDRVRQSKNTDNSLKSLNEWKQWGARWEDYLFGDRGFFCKTENMQLTNAYNTDTLRRTRYFEDLDFYKSQSNWQGVKEQMNISI